MDMQRRRRRAGFVLYAVHTGNVRRTDGAERASAAESVVPSEPSDTRTTRGERSEPRGMGAVLGTGSMHGDSMQVFGRSCYGTGARHVAQCV